MTILMGLILLQDGLSTGLVYGLVSISILLVFLATRVLWVPAGDLVVFSAFTFTQLGQGLPPSVLWLTVGLGVAAAVVELVSGLRLYPVWTLAKRVGAWLAVPLLLAAGMHLLGPGRPPLLLQIVLTLLLVAPLGVFIYRVALQPIMNTSVLTLLFAAVAIHLAMIGIGLVLFGPDGFRAAPFISGRFNIGTLRESWHLVVVLCTSLAIMMAMWAFFGRTMAGKALKATALNRTGAVIVGLWVESAGLWAFGIASLVCAVSGLLIAPMVTLYYDSGFTLALKGFVSVVLGGMASFPVSAIGALGVGV